MSDDPNPDATPEMLIAIARARMPFGRYAGSPLLDVPTPYLVWLEQRGWPIGHLGAMLQTVLEIKSNGLEPLVRPLASLPDPYADPNRTEPR